jgi:2-iminobutanoate/2-iminopropanoate deaminase
MNSSIYHRRELEHHFLFSQARRAGDLLFVSGSLSWDMDGNVVGVGDWGIQVSNVYADIAATLSHFGLTFRNVVKENVYCLDMENFVAVSGIRQNFYDPQFPPAATWVQIMRLVNPNLLLEVEIVASFG